MGWEDVQKIDPKWTWLIGILTIFLCWLSQEVMERAFGMAPAIRLASDIHDNARRDSNPIRHLKVNKRVTKSLDHQGRFRITTRGTVYYIKGTWTVFLFIASLAVFISNPDWFRAHFIDLDPSTVDFWPYQHVSASIAAYYSWEVTCNRYGKLNYSVLMHHWFTVFAALLILLGVYTPFATWYGFVQVSWCFPIGYAMAFRTTFSNKYADLMRNWFRFIRGYDH